jgi:DNA-binding HxlR family transcriptional regulator
MPIEAFARLDCPVARPLSILGERWTLLVLRELFLGRRRFDEIQATLGIASNVLTERLATLVDEGIVERHRYSDRPERFEYRPTDTGRDLVPVMLELIRWSDRHMPVKGGPIRESIHADCGHVFEPVQTCSHCGGEVHAGSVRSRVGPGAKPATRRAEQRWLKRRAAASAG